MLELYDSGAVKKDNIVNVRFEITDAGLEALYNNAPSIYISSDNFSKYLGETYKLTEGVNVYDDLDGTLGESSIKTTYRKTGNLPAESTNGSTQSGSTSSSTRTSSEGSDNSSDTPNIGNSVENNNTSNGDTTNKLPEDPGLYEITYIATDSWGRQSTATRNITINPGINRHELLFGGRDNLDHDLTAFKLKLTENNNTKKPKITFEAFVYKVIEKSHGIPEYYNIKIFRGNVENNTSETVFSGLVDAQDNPKDANFSIKSIEGKELEYGDKIKITAKQTPNFSIKGEILGDVYTDYSKGVGNRYYLDYVTFEITKNGLVAHYDDSTMAIDENVFTIVDRGGLNPFRIKIKPTTSNTENSIGTLIVTKNGEEILYDDRDSSKKILKISLIRAKKNSSVQNIQKDFTGGKANSGQNNTNLNAFNNVEVYEGDYLEISFKKPEMIYFMGKYNSRSNSKVDYNEGAKEADNLENVRFYFTKDTSNESRTGESNSILLPVYNEAPEITGMDFKRVPVNNTYDLLQGVVTSDQIDDALNKKVKLVIKCTELGINKTVTQNANKVTSSSGIRSIFSRTTNSTNSNDSTTVFNKDTSNEGTIDANLEIDMTAFNYKFDKSGIFNIEYTMTDSWGRTTTEYRTIQVYGSPEIEPKKDVVQNETTEQGEKVGTVTVELNSMKDNIEAYMESYFRSLVSISDVEDDDKDLKVEIEGQVNPKEVGIYPVNYKVTDTHGNITMYKINVNVVKTIKATVTTDIPFQVVTNLLKENGTAENIEDRFVSSKIRIKNNNPNSKMEVYVKGLSKSEGDLELVNGDNFEFNSLNKFEALRKMALGLYFIESTNEGDENIREGENSELPTETTKVFTKESPLWLTTDMTQTKITTMKEASGNKHDITLPSKNNSDTGTAQPPEGGDSEEGDEEQPSSRTDSSDQQGENPPSSTEEDENLKNPDYYIKDYGTVEGKVLEFGLTAKYGNNFAGGKVRGKFKLIFEFR